jgi:hypothetical protein
MRHIIWIPIAIVAGCEFAAPVDADEDDEDEGDEAVIAEALDADGEAPADGCRWRVETVVTGRQLLGTPAFAVGPSGGVHVLFYDNGGSLEYARRNARSHRWTVTMIASQLGNSDKRLSLAIDADRVLHASIGQDPNQLLYARRVPREPWNFVQVDPGTIGLGTGGSSALAVDDSGEVHIAYSAGSPFFGLMYAHGRFPLFTRTSVPTAIPQDPVGWFPSIRVDADRSVHVSHVRVPGGDLLYSHLPAGGSWSTTQVDALPTTGLSSSIEVDRTGGVHIAYDDNLHLHQRYAYKPPGGSWMTSMVDDDHVFSRSMIRVDSAGRLHLVYAGGSFFFGIPVRVRHASAAIGGPWTIDIVGSDGGPGPEFDDFLFGPQIVIDARDRLHVLYMRRFDELRYARGICR